MTHPANRYRLRRQAACKRSGGVIVPADRPSTSIALYCWMVVLPPDLRGRNVCARLARCTWSVPAMIYRCSPMNATICNWLQSDFGFSGFVDMVGVTGSIPVAPTTQSYPNRKSERRLGIGRFCGDVLWYRSTLSVSGDTLRSLTPILASRLCIQKFRSPRQGFRWPDPGRPLGIFGV
jgi:hypothetical protein